MSRGLAIALLLVGVAGACGRGEPELVTDAATLRLLPQSEVIGSVGAHGNHVWRGLPFAQPPVGELRWRAPLPLEGWGGTREALRDGAQCVQFMAPRDGAPGLVGSEDCLYLNVFAPAFPAGQVPRGRERLPVMVWIHGGGNSVGSATNYDGGRLAQENRLVVVVAQYRLGPLGWFRHAALREPDGSAEDASGNYATLDLIEALRWVHNNVSEFGGDPGKVTIFGESAGGRNVYSLLLSPQAGSLFQRAIAQSGALDLDSPASAENPADAPEPGHPNSGSEVVARLLVAHAGAADRAAALERAAAMPRAELAAFLRARSPAELLAAMGERGPGLGMIRFPQIFGDGLVLPEGRPLELLASGRYHQVPLIVGTNRDEQKLFMSLDPRYVGRRLGFLPYALDWTRYERDAEYQSKVWKLNAVDAPAPILRRVQGPSVWAYRFDWDDLPRRPWLDLARLLGAAHALDVPFVFGTFEMDFLPVPFDGGNLAERDQLSDQMRSYWAQFAYAGDPGRGRSGVLPEWTAWDDSRADAPRLMLFDTASDGGVRASSEVLTSAGLAAQLAADPRYADAAERCRMLAELQAWREAFSPADLQAAGCGTPAVASGG
jgi:para-nitrobenzyl esterase